MNEFAQMREAVLRALREAGLDAREAFPDLRGRRAETPVVSVAVGAMEGKRLGFCNYLGEETGSDGRVRERYGKLLEGVISVDVRAVRAADCERAVERTAGVLLSGLPEGIRPGELRWEALAWERTSEGFLRRGTLACAGLFFALDEGDGEAFLDFILKGVLRS